MNQGYILAEKYRLISLIGRGGMGSVWRAERLTWRSNVAVKLMDRATEASPEIRARFQQEARLAANLRSPHVVQILDDGFDATSGTPFIVMELLVGESLAQRLARQRCLAPADTARIITQVARALSLAHEMEMVHRDLKPDNIFLVRNDDEELAKVLDFGIAKWNVESFEMNAATATGSAMGTPAYMSPEQISDAKRVDYRTDLWSLGVIAYECITGRRSFEADNLLGLALQICNQRPPAPSSVAAVPIGFDDWFERATAHRAADRFQSARELADGLRRLYAPSAAPPSRDAAILVDAALLSGSGRAAPKPSATATFNPLEAHPKSVAGLTRTDLGRPSWRLPGGLDRRVIIAVIAGFLLIVTALLLPRLESPSATRSTAPQSSTTSGGWKLPDTPNRGAPSRSSPVRPDAGVAPTARQEPVPTPAPPPSRALPPQPERRETEPKLAIDARTPTTRAAASKAVPKQKASTPTGAKQRKLDPLFERDPKPSRASLEESTRRGSP
jgi:eukaryotic-like serine/threonine-protein kinase